MSTPSKRSAIRLPDAEDDREIVAAALSDPDAQPLTDRQLAAMKPLRGRPPSANTKQLVSVRYSPEVIEFFRSTGDGWQSRMDAVLRDYVARQAGRR